MRKRKEGSNRILVDEELDLYGAFRRLG